MIRVSALRFFLIVSPLPVWMRVALGAAVLVGAATLWLNPRDADSGFGSILFLQMFCASTGYTATASRGHYDALLVSGRPRVRIAIGHLLASILPGAIAWVLIAGLAAGLGQPDIALSLHRYTALALVSAGAWALGLAVPRMAAGALWATLLLTLALSRGIGRYLAVVEVRPGGLYEVMWSATAFAVCPYLLLGEPAAAASPGVMAIELALVAALILGGTLYLTRREYGLVEPA